MLRGHKDIIKINDRTFMFQWAPTLGGECYAINVYGPTLSDLFQWAPTLGGECYLLGGRNVQSDVSSFNGHPPLGVNATACKTAPTVMGRGCKFQLAPTLGGECYRRVWSQPRRLISSSFNGHPPLGVNATAKLLAQKAEHFWDQFQ